LNKHTEPNEKQIHSKAPQMRGFFITDLYSFYTFTDKRIRV